MYPATEITKVPGGYITQSKIVFDEDTGEEGYQTVVFTTWEGVMEYLSGYFSEGEYAEDSDSDGGIHVVLDPDTP